MSRVCAVFLALAVSVAGCGATSAVEATHIDELSAASGAERVMPFVGKTAIYDGARCYSAVSYWHGMLGAPLDIGPAFMTAWARSPLMTSIDGSELRAGDIIALGPARGDGVPTDHVAVIQRTGEVFQKAGSPSEFPFELLTWAAFVAKYPEVSEAKFYRPTTSFDELLASASMTDARQAHARLVTLEQSLARYMIIDASWNDASDAWYEAFDRTLRETKAEASVIATELRGRVDAAEPSARWVYQLLLLRAEELGYHEGPFD